METTSRNGQNQQNTNATPDIFSLHCAKDQVGKNWVEVLEVILYHARIWLHSPNHVKEFSLFLFCLEEKEVKNRKLDIIRFITLPSMKGIRFYVNSI